MVFHHYEAKVFHKLLFLQIILFEKIFCNKIFDTKEPNKLGLFW
jgi:hypothetical protein